VALASAHQHVKLSYNLPTSTLIEDYIQWAYSFILIDLTSTYLLITVSALTYRSASFSDISAKPFSFHSLPPYDFRTKIFMKRCSLFLDMTVATSTITPMIEETDCHYSPVCSSFVT